jgi:hypothetical protein
MLLLDSKSSRQADKVHKPNTWYAYASW